MFPLRLTWKSLLFNFIAIEPTDHFGGHVFCKHTLGLQLYNLKIYFFLWTFKYTNERQTNILSYILWKIFSSLTGYKNLWGRGWVGFFFLKKWNYETGYSFKNLNCRTWHKDKTPTLGAWWYLPWFTPHTVIYCCMILITLTRDFLTNLNSQDNFELTQFHS